MIRFECSCGRQLQAKPEHAGRRVACPACGTQLVVPGDDLGVQPPAPGPARPGGEARVRQAPASRRPADEDDPPRRRGDPEEGEREPAREGATSGKAIFSLILGLVSVVCACNLFAGLPALVLGFLALRDVKGSRGKITGGGLAIGGIITGIVGIVICSPVLGFGGWYGWGLISERGSRDYSQNNLKQMGLAMHNYSDIHRHFPEQGISGPPGMRLRPGQKPNLSWRVAILPYIEQKALYQQFKLNEPWDGPNNKKLIPLMPKIYELPGQPSPGTGMTYYQVFAGPGTAFDPSQGPLRFSNITDGTSNTILAVEAAKPVIWTKPDDLEMTRGGPIPALGGHYQGGFNALMFDGSVRWLRQDTPTQSLRAAITPNGGEVVFLP